MIVSELKHISIHSLARSFAPLRPASAYQALRLVRTNPQVAQSLSTKTHNSPRLILSVDITKSLRALGDLARKTEESPTLLGAFHKARTAFKRAVQTQPEVRTELENFKKHMDKSCWTVQDYSPTILDSSIELARHNAIKDATRGFYTPPSPFALNSKLMNYLLGGGKQQKPI